MPQTHKKVASSEVGRKLLFLEVIFKDKNQPSNA